MKKLLRFLGYMALVSLSALSMLPTSAVYAATVSQTWTGGVNGVNEVQWMQPWGGNLYASVYRDAQATEIWKYNGTTWALAYTARSSESMWNAVIFGNYLVWTGGVGADPNPNMVHYTLNGADWNSIATSSVGVSSSNVMTVHGSRLYVCNRVGDVSYTENLADWTSTADVTDGLTIYGATSFNGSLYVATGNPGGGFTLGHLYKYDETGDSWTQINFPVAGTALAVNGLTTFGGKIYAGIRIGTETWAAIYSYDGSNWQHEITLPKHTGQMFPYGDNLYVGIQGGAVLGSSGGLAVLKNDGDAGYVTSVYSQSSVAVYDGDLYTGTRRENALTTRVINYDYLPEVREGVVSTRNHDTGYSILVNVLTVVVSAGVLVGSVRIGQTAGGWTGFLVATIIGLVGIAFVRAALFGIW